MQNTFDEISSLIDLGSFEEAKNETALLLANLDKHDDGSDVFSIGYYNAASFLVDIAHANSDAEIALYAATCLENLESRVIDFIEPHQYFYNLANAKSNLVISDSPLNISFTSIETLIDAKNYYWKSIKEARAIGKEFPEQYVNLANCLNYQFRFSEALRYYESVIESNPEIPQAWINQSESLLMLNTVSNSFSIRMLDKACSGYETAANSNAIPKAYAEYYATRSTELRDQIRELGIEITEDNHAETRKEFESLSEYRQTCCTNSLTLSEHGLYCSCAGSARDNLTIPLISTPLGGEFIPQMEAVLNRLKSEYSLARRCFYEYSTPEETSTKLIHEECFTDLKTSECLGLNYEKLRISFRLCFGILDKIALAICDHYLLHPKKQKIYFHNFWQLDRDDRRSKFEEIKNPGLLALYSIATDLNKHKQGEWQDFKRFRNALEHGFLVLTKSDQFEDTYNTYQFSNDVEFVSINNFELLTEQMLQLVRSAIFSFVFSFRNKALNMNSEGGIKVSFNRFNID